MENNHFISKKTNQVFAYLFLFIITSCIYWQTNEFSFVGLDDSLYVIDNPYVQKGITLDSIRWAFTGATEITNFWAPLTWLSILADFEIYGLNAGGYHITNLIYHLMNSLLVLLVFHQMTGSLWKSFFIAIMFALHPLHVESVAWVTERKDVLSTFFWLLTMWAYWKYSKNPGIPQYLLIFFFFILGMMAKPMLVTLPFAMLLLDFWPLGRLKITSPKAMIYDFLWLFLEKTPLFFCVIAISVVTYYFQDKGGVLPSVQLIPMYLRIENVIVSYGLYLWKTIWPFQLAAIYPYPAAIPNWKVGSSFILLFFITIVSIKRIRTAPWFLFAWLWYMGTLVPVIGFVVVGPHSMADRYMYVPSIGIFLIMAWGIPELLKNFRYKTKYIRSLFVIAILFYSAITWYQIKHWRNSFALFKHTLETTTENPIAHDGFANALAKQGNIDEAIRHYKRSIELYPYSAEVHNNLGVAYFKADKTKKAIQQYKTALELKPDYVAAMNNLGNALKKNGQYNDAEPYFRRALQITPNSPILNLNLGICLLGNQQIEAAIPYLEKAAIISGFEIPAYNSLYDAFQNSHQEKQAVKYFSQLREKNPNQPIAHYILGKANTKKGHYQQAIVNFSEALRLHPNYLDTAIHRQKIFHRIKQIEHAIELLENKRRAEPQDHQLLYQLGELYNQKEEIHKAKQYYLKSLEIQRDYVPALNKLGFLYASIGRYEQAIGIYSRLSEILPSHNSIDYNIACMYSKLNKKKKAIEWLQSALKKGYKNYEQVKTDRDFDNIRDTKQYKLILNKLSTP